MSPLHWSMSLVASSSAVEYTRMIWSVPPTTNTLHPEHHHNIEWPRARASHSRMASCVVVVQQQYILARAVGAHQAIAVTYDELQRGLHCTQLPQE